MCKEKKKSNPSIAAARLIADRKPTLNHRLAARKIIAAIEKNVAVFIAQAPYKQG